MTELKPDWWVDPTDKSRDTFRKTTFTEQEIQESIDITIKRGVGKKYDEELGLTGRDIHQIICRLGAALEERDIQLDAAKFEAANVGDWDPEEQSLASWIEEKCILIRQLEDEIRIRK
jgi:hypothetical protein